MACAVSVGREVGVDVERIDRQLVHDVAERFFSEREVADLRALPIDEQETVFFDYWTLKESYIKARGLGLALPLGQFTFLRTPGRAPSIAFAPELHDDPTSWQFAQFWPTSEHRMAVAVRRTGRRSADRRRSRSSRGSRVNLWAISDLHVGFEENRRAVESLESYADDWLILAGDTGETPAHLDFVLRHRHARSRRSSGRLAITICGRRATLEPERRGVAHYERLVKLCRSYGVLTPEDPYAVWPGDGPRTAIVPTFVLYDYSFRPDDVAADGSGGVGGRDGRALRRRGTAESRSVLDAPGVVRIARRATPNSGCRPIPRDTRIILVNHWPLRRDHAVLPRMPRFSIWCGTRATEDWHQRYSGRHRGLRPPAHARDARAGRRAIRRSVARVPAAVGSAQGRGTLLATDSIISWIRTRDGPRDSNHEANLRLLRALRG